MGLFTHDKCRFPAQKLFGSTERNLAFKCGDESTQKGELVLER